MLYNGFKTSNEHKLEMIYGWILERATVIKSNGIFESVKIDYNLLDKSDKLDMLKVFNIDRNYLETILNSDSYKFKDTLHSLYTLNLFDDVAWLKTSFEEQIDNIAIEMYSEESKDALEYWCNKLIGSTDPFKDDF